MAARQEKWSRVEETLELSVGHEGATEGHAANVCAEEEGGLDGVGSWVGGEVREVVEVGGNAGEDSCCSYQAVGEGESGFKEKQGKVNGWR